MKGQNERTALLIGEDKVTGLQGSAVAIFGIGGVGGFVCEALARAGIGEFLLVDDDEVSITNINRQIVALHSTLGQKKTEVMRTRILDINPLAKVEVRNTFFLPANADSFDFGRYDYVVDAVDTVTAKLALIMKAKAEGTPVISCMGAGNKLDPTAFKIADIYDTKICPLAKVMRKELKKRGIDSLKVLYSEEEPIVPAKPEEEDTAAVHKKRSTPGSISFVPSVAGLIIAGEVIKDLTANDSQR